MIEFDARICPGPGTKVVNIYGDVDIASRIGIGRLFDQLAEQGDDTIVVSLADCTYCDSNGVNALMALKKRVGPRLRVIIPPNCPARRVFEICGLVEFLGLGTLVALA